MQALKKSVLSLALGIAMVFGLASKGSAAEAIKIAGLKITVNGPIFLAIGRGYFAAERLAPELVFVDTCGLIASAELSGSVSFGTCGLTAAFYNAAGQGALKLIAGSGHEAPGFPNTVYLVSNQAYASGLKSFRDFPGHTLALAVLGGPDHYPAALLAQKYNFDLNSMRIVTLQSVAAKVTAVVGGKADVAIAASTVAIPAIDRSAAKGLGFIGDETPWQIGAVSTTAKTIAERPDLVSRFLEALRKGTRDYHDAFADNAGNRRDGADANAVLAIIAKYLGEPIGVVAQSIAYIDAEGRLDVPDVLRQIAWYKSQGFVKPEVDGAKVIDPRYVVPLPEK